MARATYDEALRHVLAHEGGYVDHPRDPGGETNYGITVAVARANGYAGPMRSIPMATVKRIYRTRYWDALQCDALPAGVDYAVFDYGVNSGVSRSAKVLQRVCGVIDDGRIGPVTLAAVARRRPDELVKALCDERMAFLKRLKTWPTFGKGWSRRVSEVRRDATSFALARPITDAGYIAPVPGKGHVPEPKAAKDAVNVGAPVATAATGAVWWEWVVANPRASVLIGVAVALAIGGALYALHRWRQIQQDAPTPGIAVVPANA